MKRRNIDVHAHIFPAKIVEKATGAIGEFYHVSIDGKGSSKDLIKHGGRIGTEKYVVHSVATKPEQVGTINRFIREEVAAHPEFCGFATLHPLMKDMEKEIELAIEGGMRGIKLHPDFQRFYIDEDSSIEMYKKIDNSLPILMHMGDERTDFSKPRRLARVIDMLPEKTFIGAHFGGYSDWDEAKEYLIGKRDLYIDTCSSLFKLPAEEAVDMIRMHGVDKVLFGTDYPMWLPEKEFALFLNLDLTEEERDLILCQNADKLLFQ